MLAVSIRKLSLSLVLVTVLGASALGAGLVAPTESAATYYSPAPDRFPKLPEKPTDEERTSLPRCILVLKHSYIGTTSDGERIYVDYWEEECY